MLTFNERLHTRWANLHSAVKFILVTSVLAAAVFFSWKPAGNIYRSWQTKRDLKGASKALEAKEYAEARQLAFSALRSDKNIAPSLPILLKAMDALGDRQRARIATAYLSLQGEDENERLDAWKIVCRSASTGVAASTWRMMKNSETINGRFLEPWAERLIKEGLIDEAAKQLGNQPQPLPVDLERLFLNTMALRNDLPVFLQLQLRLIARLQTAPEDGGVLLGVMDLVPNDSLLASLSPAAEKWHAIAPSVSVLDELRLVRFKMVAEPAKAVEIFSRTYESFSVKEPLATARWCLWIGRQKDAEKLLIPLSKAGDLEAYTTISRIYHRLGRYDEWATILAESPPGPTPAIRECDRAFIAFKKSDQHEQAAAEQRCFSAATGQQNSDDLVIELARHASQLELNDLSRRLWVEAIIRGVGPLPVSNQLAPLFKDLAERKDEDTLFSILTAYRYLEPGNPGILCRHLYLSCLRGQATPKQVIKELEMLTQRGYPSDSQFTSILALAHLLEGDVGKAVELTELPDVDWKSGPPARRAIRAIALSRASRGNEAHELLEGMPWDKLLPSEKRIFEEMLKQP